METPRAMGGVVTCRMYPRRALNELEATILHNSMSWRLIGLNDMSSYREQGLYRPEIRTSDGQMNLCSSLASPTNALKKHVHLGANYLHAKNPLQS